MTEQDILKEQAEVYAYPRIVAITDADDREEMTEDELVRMFDEALDEAEDVNVGGYTFPPSRVLKELDPIAYQCELRNYADSIRDIALIRGWND